MLRETETALVGKGQREREGEKPKQAPCSQPRAQHGTPTLETVRS